MLDWLAWIVVGLAATGDDGRVVHAAGWPWPDQLSGVQDAAVVRARGTAIVDEETGREVRAGRLDVGKRLRPNRRGGRTVLFVRRDGEIWRAVRLP